MKSERSYAAARSSASRRQLEDNRPLRGRGASSESEAVQQEAAKQWIRRNQGAALIGAFALGVFVGAWMRG